jgi:hypothetical protein
MYIFCDCLCHPWNGGIRVKPKTFVEVEVGEMSALFISAMEAMVKGKNATVRRHVERFFTLMYPENLALAREVVDIRTLAPGEAM